MSEKNFNNSFKDGLDNFKKGSFSKSEIIFTNLLQKYPKKFDLYTYLIPSLINQNKLEEAQTHSKFFYKQSPNYKEISLIYLGIINLKFGKLEESINFFLESRKINPKNFHTLLNLGVAYHKFKDNNNAIKYTLESLKINENNSIAYQNLSSFLEDENELDKAMNYLEEALKINSKDFDSLHALSLLQLLTLNYKDGLANFEKRFLTTHQSPRHSHLKKLSPDQDIKGKKILVWHEQGMGDTIQFSRLANNLVNLGGIITLEVQKPLEKFLSNQFTFKVSDEIKDKNFDFQLPLLSMLSYFDISPNNIPKFQNYFKSDEKKYLFWKAKLPIAKDKINIGLSISGNKKHKKEYRRNIPLEKFILLSNEYRIFLIQKEITKEENLIIRKNQEIYFLGDDLGWEDFTDTSAIVENMDFVVSIDTSLIHLAGTMNKKSYLLLSSPPDWRWGYDKHNELNWYDSVHIIRQKTVGNWDGVIEKLKLLLKE